MSNVTPKNERLAANLAPDPKAEYQRLSAATEKLAAKRPDFAPAYQEYREAWLDHAMASDRRVMEVRRKSEKLGVRPQVADLQRMRDEDRNRFTFDIEKRMKKYGPAGDEAGAALGKEMKKNVVSEVVSNFYDEEKGGVQWGGIAGALLGGLLLSSLAGGMGTWFGILAIILGAAAGGWLGNMAGDAIRERTGGSEKTSPAASEPGQARTQELSPEGAERQAKIKAALEKTTQPPQPEPATHPTIEELGGLSPKAGGANPGKTPGR